MKIHDCFDETAFAPLVLGGILIFEKWIYIIFSFFNFTYSTIIYLIMLDTIM